MGGGDSSPISSSSSWARATALTLFAGVLALPFLRIWHTHFRYPCCLHPWHRAAMWRHSEAACPAVPHRRHLPWFISSMLQGMLGHCGWPLACRVSKKSTCRDSRGCYKRISSSKSLMHESSVSVPKTGVFSWIWVASLFCRCTSMTIWKYDTESMQDVKILHRV